MMVRVVHGLLNGMKCSRFTILGCVVVVAILVYFQVVTKHAQFDATIPDPYLQEGATKLSFKATDLSQEPNIELNAQVVQAELDKELIEMTRNISQLAPYSQPAKETYANFSALPLTKDNTTGLFFPPRLPPGTHSAANLYPRAKAAFVVLIRNSELNDIRRPIRQIEDRVNKKFGYPWIFLNDEEFIPEFKTLTSGLVSGEAHYGLIPKEHWSYPPWIDQQKSEEGRAQLEQEGVVYGGSLSYRHMCRFNSGLFFKHPLLKDLDYYWRVEPHTQTHCDVDYDPFLFMAANGKIYGFTIAMYEFEATIKTLWQSVREFVKLQPKVVPKDNGIRWMTDTHNDGLDGRYNLCHHWSNHEIADLRFWRSPQYQTFFNYLDRKGGFYYERWGDAPVHSIAVTLFLERKRLHHFWDMGYMHTPYTACPVKKEFHSEGKCDCDPLTTFDYDGYSCLRQYEKVYGRHPEKPFKWIEEKAKVKPVLA